MRLDRSKSGYENSYMLQNLKKFLYPVFFLKEDELLKSVQYLKLL